MRKFLIVAHYSRFLVQFEMNNVHILQQLGYEVHYATNYRDEDMYKDAVRVIKANNVILHQIDFVRSPYDIISNIKAYGQLRKLMLNEHFAGVHCHTPMAGALARLAANAAKIYPVIYTAHGFHFYKGCPLKNRVIYENAERILATFTDAQITINKEDYEVAQTFHLRGKAYYIHGVGIDIEKISNVKADREAVRKQLGISQEALVFVTVGELILRKNHEMLIKAFCEAHINNSVLLICGSGKERKHYERIVDMSGCSEKIIIAGFCSNIIEILKASDIFVFPSLQEGLPVALMEAMAAGMPCIASSIRGNVDLLTDSKYLFTPKDKNALIKLMKEASRSSLQIEKEKNKRIVKKFDVGIVRDEMRAIYCELLDIKEDNADICVE